MSRKDYELIAAVLSEVYGSTDNAGVRRGVRIVAANLSAAFSEENRTFDEGRFLSAVFAGVE